MTKLETAPSGGPRLVASEQIRRFLEIHAPLRHPLRQEKPDPEAGTSFSFSRTRKVHMLWEGFATAEAIQFSEVDQLRRRIEAHWGITENLEPDLSEWIEPAREGEYLFWENWGQPNGEKKELPEGTPLLTLLLRKRGKRWAALPTTGGPLEFEADYEDAWRRARIVRVELRGTDEVEGAKPAGPTRADSIFDTDSTFNLDQLLADDRVGPIFGPDGRFLYPPRGPRDPSYGIPRAPSVPGRADFERFWGLLPTPEVLARVLKKTTAGEQFWRLVDKPPTQQEVFAEEAESLEAIPENEWVMNWAGRWYWIQTDEALGEQNLTDPASYREFWRQDGAIGLELVAENKADPPFTLSEDFDLQPAVIEQQYKELEAELRLANKLEAIALKLSDRLDTGSDAAPTTDEIERLTSRYRELVRPRLEIEKARDLLVERAARLGYVLALQADKTKKVRGGGFVEEGKLYRKTVRYVRVPARVRSRSRRGGIPLPLMSPISRRVVRGLFGRRRRRRPKIRYVRRKLTEYHLVRPSQEPWAERREELEEKGYECSVLELTDNGFVTEDGVEVGEIMARCEYEEAYRRKLVLFLPAFEDTLRRGLVKVRYEALIRPLPGVVAVEEPELYLEEELSYRTEWRGTELGELIQSFNLAPGEEREVTVTREIVRKTEEVESITSVLDVVRERRSEFTTMVEDTLRNEKQTTTTTNWNVKAGASIGVANVSGGVGGSHTKSSKQFAQTVKRSASKASQRLREQQKVEVTSSSRTETRVQRAESTSSTIRNINDGRTLNLLFYNLDNVFLGGLFLENLRFVHFPSVEIVAGTGIREPRTYEFEQLPLLLKESTLDPGFSGIFEDRMASLQIHILRRLSATIFEEYTTVGNTEAVDDRTLDREIEKIRALDRSTGVLKLPLDVQPEELRAALGLGEADSPIVYDDPVGLHEVLDHELHMILRLLGRLRIEPKAVEPHRISVPSGATYLDAVVGSGEATEQYSERMREHELAVREADAWHRRAEAQVLEARAASSRGLLDEEWTVAREPRILKVSATTEGALIELSGELPPGSWIASTGDEVLGPAERQPGDQRRVVIRRAAASSADLELRDNARRLAIRA